MRWGWIFVSIYRRVLAHFGLGAWDRNRDSGWTGWLHLRSSSMDFMTYEKRHVMKI